MESISLSPTNSKVTILYFKRPGVRPIGHRKISVGKCGALNPPYGKLVTKANILKRRELTGGRPRVLSPQRAQWKQNLRKPAEELSRQGVMLRATQPRQGDPAPGHSSLHTTQPAA